MTTRPAISSFVPASSFAAGGGGDLATVLFHHKRNPQQDAQRRETRVTMDDAENRRNMEKMNDRKMKTFYNSVH